MNPYPSWIRRIPAMIEALALTATDPVDRRMAEQLFELRKTAAVQLLRRFGALYRGGSLVISRALLMARLREAHENLIGAGRANGARPFAIALNRCGRNRHASASRRCPSMRCSNSSWNRSAQLACPLPSRSARGW